MSPLTESLIDIMPETMGACLVGSYLSSVLYGLTLLQTYQYYSRYYGQDKGYLPILVAILTVLDTFAVILNMIGMWDYLIKNFDNALAILNINWTLTFSIMATSIVAFLVQMFYAYRAYILGEKRLIIPCLITLFSLSSLAFAIYYIALLYRNGSLLYIPTVTYLPTTSLACSLAADLLIASSISVYLMQGRLKGLRPTNNIIHRLVIYTIGTGVITIACTTVTLILGEAFSHTFYNTISYFPLSKCYVNSMLAFLNIRNSLREETQFSKLSFNNKVSGWSRGTQQTSTCHLCSGRNTRVQYDISSFSDDSRVEEEREKLATSGSRV